MAGELPFGLAPSGELTAYTPTLRERVSDWLRPMLFSDDRAGQEKANRLTNWAETMIPPFGFATQMYDTGRAGGEGDYLTAGTLGAMAFVPGGSKKGIRAYHGSPHSFDKFSMDKIGTGEGAQAYGHGLYFAENEGVARDYRNKLAKADLDGPYANAAPDTPEAIVAARLKNARQGFASLNTNGGQYSDIDGQAVAYVKQNINDALEAAVNSGDFTVFQKLSDQKNAFERMVEGGVSFKPSGSMYEVNIDADPNAFLDWDKPLSEQPEVQARLATIGEAARSSTTKGVDKYISLENLLGDRPAVTAKLREAGIPGIKYLDAGSRVPSRLAQKELDGWKEQLDYAQNELAKARANGERHRTSYYEAEVKRAQDGLARTQKEAEGTRNYVVFDDNLISIVRKYGIAGASAMLGYNLLESVNPAQADELKRIEAGK